MLNDKVYHALATSVAVLLAFVMQHYYSFSHEYWLTLAALLVCQTTRGTPLRQGLIFFMVMVTALLMASVVKATLAPPFVLYLIVTVLFIIISHILFMNGPLSYQHYFTMVQFPIFFMLAVLSPVNVSTFTQARIIDVGIGSVIGSVCVTLLSPMRANKAFTQDLLPLLHALREYVHELTLFFQGNTTSPSRLIAKKISIETILSTPGQYPEWVYEVGFNYGLRAGFRFFLVHLERMTEVLFSMEYLAFAHSYPLLLDALSTHMTEAMQKNEKLIRILITYFSQQGLESPQADFTSDIIELEQALNRLVPSSLELIDISKNNLLLTAWVRDIKDMRELLLQLILALAPP